MIPAHEYLVSFGKNGGFGRFTAADLVLQRGQAVVLQTARGTEMGTVLCPATSSHARLLQAPASGAVLRVAGTDDEGARTEVGILEQVLFQRSRQLVSEQALPIEILDVEIPLNRAQVILQYLGMEECDANGLIETLGAEFDLPVRLENLATAVPAVEEHGCGEPNCGQKSGGCTSCSSGGCSSCGSKNFDIEQYFGHLRGQMEASGRVAIL